MPSSTDLINIDGQLEYSELQLTSHRYIYLFYIIMAFIMLIVIYRVFIIDKSGSPETIICVGAGIIILYHVLSSIYNYFL
jgi:hypothetical protein